MSHFSGEPLLSFRVFDFDLVLTFPWKEEIQKKRKKSQVPHFFPLFLDIAVLSKQYSQSQLSSTVHLSPFFGKKYCWYPVLKHTPE